MQYELREIDENDKVKVFSSGDKDFTPLKTFLVKNSKLFHKNNIAKTYVITTEESKVISYVTIACSQIKLAKDEKPQDLKQCEKYEFLPAIKILRLATDSEHRENGYGQKLIEHVISTVWLEIMPKVGCRYLIVDSKSNAIEFYEKRGFYKINGNDKNKTTVMYLDLHKLLA